MEEGKTTKTLPQKKIQGLQGCKKDCLPIVRAIRTAYAMSSQSKILRLPEMTKTSKTTHTFQALFAQKGQEHTFAPPSIAAGAAASLHPSYTVVEESCKGKSWQGTKERLPPPPFAAGRGRGEGHVAKKKRRMVLG